MRGICKHLGCQCVRFPRCCLSANTRPQQKVSRENYVLRENNYPLSFIQSCKFYHNSSRRDSSTNGSSSASAWSAASFVVLPYVRGASEKISRVQRNNGVKVGYKPLSVLRTCFLRPKDKSPALQCRGVVYRVACVDCNSVYYGQTDRALETRLKEHKRAVRVGDNNSKVAQHANQFVHSIDFDHVTIVEQLQRSLVTFLLA